MALRRSRKRKPGTIDKTAFSSGTHEPSGAHKVTWGDPVAHNVTPAEARTIGHLGIVPNTAPQPPFGTPSLIASTPRSSIGSPMALSPTPAPTHPPVVVPAASPEDDPFGNENAIPTPHVQDGLKRKRGSSFGDLINKTAKEMRKTHYIHNRVKKVYRKWDQADIKKKLGDAIAESHTTPSLYETEVEAAENSKLQDRLNSLRSDLGKRKRSKSDESPNKKRRVKELHERPKRQANPRRKNRSHPPAADVPPVDLHTGGRPGKRRNSQVDNAGLRREFLGNAMKKRKLPEMPKRQSNNRRKNARPNPFPKPSPPSRVTEIRRKRRNSQVDNTPGLRRQQGGTVVKKRRLGTYDTTPHELARAA